jgi:hypothetical protein
MHRTSALADQWPVYGVQLMMLRGTRQGGVHVLLALMYLSDFVLM